MSTNVKRAALYARVSTTRQAEHDLSIPDQVNQLKAYCDRKGWVVAETYIEPGASALDENRPIFQNMIAAATSQARPYDYIVVHSFSRFSRNSMHSQLYSHKLKKAGALLISITQELSDDATGTLVQTILNAVDQMNSSENAKHTHRAMMENARQGFWNGSRPPFGYSLAVKERRGNKDKKVLVIQEEEAKIVRQLFDLYLGRQGRPLGLKSICTYFNDRGILRRGHKWGIGSLQDLITSPTYCGRHYFNRMDTRKGQVRPDSECIEVAVPAIISEDDYNNVQAALEQRSPRKTPPRVVNGPTMLAGVVRCEHCGAAMIQNTGKGGKYRYYACSNALKKGKTVCIGHRIPMDKLDGIVLEHIGSKIFDPERLETVLQTYIEAQASGTALRKERLRQLRQSKSDVEASKMRLITLVENGTMEPDDPSLKERMTQLKLQSSDLNREIESLQTSLLSGAPTIGSDRIHALAEQMRERFRSGPPELRQAYMRLLLDSVVVGPGKISLTGSNAVLERLAANGASSSASEVLSFALKWRPGRDSNP